MGAGRKVILFKIFCRITSKPVMCGIVGHGFVSAANGEEAG